MPLHITREPGQLALGWTTCPCSRLVYEVGKRKAFKTNKETNTMLKRFLLEEQAQDLIEYTLLLAFVCLATSALFIGSGGSFSGIWGTANSRLTVDKTSSS